MRALSDLGPRIVVVGPSNAGKSTLAVSISQKTETPVVHLDQLHHLPNTNWQKRPDEEFTQLHDEAIARDSWVIEGNYSKLLPQRLDRANGFVLITSSMWLRYFRYVKRTLKNNSARAGHLEGGQDNLSLVTVRWIFITGRKASVYLDMLRCTGKPMVACTTAAELKQLYEDWDLLRLW
ncbi:MAG: AAA family ATPase [Pseudomonadota bacterium]